MKKSVIKVTICIMLFALCFAFASCGNNCEHIYDNNCDAICNACGEERAVLTHQWIDPNCTSPKTCEDCGLTEGEALGHNTIYCEEEEPTCTEDGTEEYWYCIECEAKLFDEEGTQPIDYEDLIIPKKTHIDENEDHICDYGCGKASLEAEKIQQIIENTLASTKVTVKETYISGARDTSYYFDENLLYLNSDRYGEKYYYTEDATTYLLTNSNGWSKEITTEVINYKISHLFENIFNLEISSELSVYNCDYGIFEGKTMFQYTNSLGTYIQVKLNDDSTLLEGIYICDENNNITHMYEIIYGENKEISNTAEAIVNGSSYDETTNIYYVYSSQVILDTVDKAELSGTTDNPATIKLINDIEVEVEVNEYGYAYYGLLIETGNIIIDLNGYQLSASDTSDNIIKIGESGVFSDAIVTIKDSSIDESGKIVGTRTGISIKSGTLIFNNGTIEVNGLSNGGTIGIASNNAVLTINGGTINCNGIATNYNTYGVYTTGLKAKFTMNGGNINVFSPSSDALVLVGTNYINGGVINTDGWHIFSNSEKATISLGTNEEGIGATFVGGIKSNITLNYLLAECVGYYDANGNLIEVADDVKEITDKGDITVKKIIVEVEAN
ncbi:MAG: hypothetical protein IJ400_00300 [Clostridia bacterium]|nr:hypothetical protein [Clostridia bacterium]